MPKPSLSPSTELFAAARAGDRVAVDALVRGQAGTVLGWCTRLGGPGVVAEDAAQDVLVVMFTRLGTVPGPDDLRPWLWGVTRRVLADHRKRAWVRRWTPGIFRSPAETSPGPEDRAALSEGARRVQSFLDTLPAAQREVFVLCDVEERTDVEVAALLQVPVGTVKSRLRFARARWDATVDAARVQPPSRTPMEAR